MTRILAGLFAAFAVIGSAQATELRPMQAHSITLGDMQGVAYYTATADGYQVVATFAAGEQGTPVRFVATLMVGQKLIVSVPRSASEEPLAVQIGRFGDSVVVSGVEARTVMTELN